MSPFSFMSSSRFLPLFVTQFLGALNDNLFKAAITVLIVYRLAQSDQSGQILATIGTGLFILPYVLFSALAGQLADKYEKSRLFRLIKLAEIVIMALGVAALLEGNVYTLLTILFLMGTQSTFFSPIKYAVLPDHLREDELLAGNAILEAGTFIAVLAGTLIGTQFVLGSFGIPLVSGLLIALAVLGYAASFFIPAAPPPVPELRLSYNLVGQTRILISYAANHRTIWLVILGISWFWMVGAVMLSQLPALAKDILHANETVLSLFLTIFSVGIGVGSVLCSRILRGEISARSVPFGALGMALAGIDLFVSTRFHIPESFLAAEGMIGFSTFIAYPFAWRVMADLFILAAAGGFFVVPLNTMMQAESDPEFRARVIATNNILNATFMVGGSLVAAAMLAINLRIPDIFAALAVGNLIATVIICQLLPESTLKNLLAAIVRRLFRVSVTGAEHLPITAPAPGQPGRVVVANHVSFLDAAFIVLFLPGKVTFAINTLMAEKWWVRPFLKLIDAAPIDPINPMAIKHLIKLVREGHNCMIFPEGRLTLTGGLMKIYDGPAMIAEKTGADIVTVRIDGLQFTPFTRLQGKLPVRLFPRVSLTALPARKIEIDPALHGRARRYEAGRKLYRLMSESIYATESIDLTLWQALLQARRTYGGSSPIIDDIERKPIGFTRLIQGAMVLGRRFAQFTAPGEAVGVLLPSSKGAAVTFFALHAYGRVPAILNFSTGAANMLLACHSAEIKTVLTSQRFIAKGKMEGVIEALKEKVRIVYLEDLRTQINFFDKFLGLFAMPRANRRAKAKSPIPDDPAVILFTSGSEGTPKGVVLSHRNIIANCRQIHTHIDFTTADSLFNPLPIFHSLGLTGGLILPLIYGVKVFLYPSPLHYKIIAELVYDTAPTLMLGTDTFLSGYARVANPYDFRSVRYIVAGAERVRDETRKTWMNTFGVRIMEGYGATEAAPVIALNNAMYFRAGTVGTLMPGIEHRLEPIPGIDNGQRLLIRGPNIMKGYLRAEAPGVLQPNTIDGWYDTGDVVSISPEGFVSITGRLKRFAKIGGEMISLSAVEEKINLLWPEANHAMTSLPDPRKGEQLVLLTTQEKAERSELLSFARAQGWPELMIPKTLIVVDKIPLLGNGKTDFNACREIAEKQAASKERQEEPS